MADARKLLELIDRIADVNVVLYGDLVLDRFILGTPKRVSREAPVIILRYEGERNVPGGGANALANLAALGTRVAAVAAVGDDDSGRALIAALNERGVDTGSIIAVPGYRTPTKIRILGGGPSSLKHQVARYDIEAELPSTGAWRDRVREALESALVNAAAIAISDYGYGGVVPEYLSGLPSSAAGGAWICLDSRYRIGRFPGVDGATPNLQELEHYCGRRLDSDTEVADAAEELRRDLGARFVLATRGNHGMTLVAHGRPTHHIPVYGTDEVADVTGAGDTVLAVLTASLAAGAEPIDAARLANIAAGLVVMKLGTAAVAPEELRAAVASTHEP
jgi:rfaE bifunctional protein kinase chain/domain